ncbi:MAG: tetratricopeptide repeat protein [Gemmatimonadetes bacterium]|nr:tetratricopeptide repeat protein [Gemmatimonadota bacterium]
MAIKGSLREASLAEVCQLLSLGLKTGCLSVADRSRFGQIFFERGRISFAKIVNRRDRLGDLLVAQGRITQQQVDDILERQVRDPERRFGELLVENGLMTEDELTRFIRIQIEEAVYHLFTWSRGQFYFEAGQRPDASETLVSINPESMLLEAAHRIDEWGLIEKKIPSLDLVFEIDRARLDSVDVELSVEQTELLPLFDGTRTVQDVVDASGRGEFDVGRALFGLLQAGFARRLGQRSEDPARSSESDVIERNNLGIAFFRTGMLDDAMREFRRTLEIEPADPVALFHLALIAIRQGRHTEAIRELSQLAREHPRRLALLVNLAVAQRLAGLAHEALRTLDLAEQVRPGDPATALARGVTLLGAGRLVEAISQFRTCRARLRAGARPPATWYYHFGLTMGIAGDVRNAQAIVWEGLETHAYSAPLLLLAGLAGEKQGDLRGAELFYRRALEVEPGLPQAHRNLGDIAYTRGANDEALRLYQRAIELDPDLGDHIHARVGALHYQARNRDAAVRAWTRALELNPANDAVRTRLEVLMHAGS